MPTGMILSSWDNQFGVNIEKIYPESTIVQLNKEDILTVFASCALSGDPGVFSMRMGNLNVISYYSGKPKGDEAQFLITILLAPDEGAKVYEDFLTGIGEVIINSVGDEDFNDFFIDCYEVASKARISEDQIISFFLRNRTNNFILEVLREGPITINQLERYLVRELKKKIDDINRYLKPFIENKIIKKYEVKSGARTFTYLLLLKDLDIMRVPPLSTLYSIKEGIDPEFKKLYLSAINKFFNNYYPSEADKKIILNIISNPSTFEIIRLLREEFIEYNEIYAKLGFEMKNTAKNLNKLTDTEIVYTVKIESGQVWLFLLSDIYASMIFPSYLIDVIYGSWERGEIDEEIALYHLNALREDYFSSIKELEESKDDD
ncbi:MAG: hypothetical protein ACTSR8_10970 [Promethearchaeota archaeon]